MLGRWRGRVEGPRATTARSWTVTALSLVKEDALLRPYTANTSSRARLFLKKLMWPGTNWVSRDKSRLAWMFLTGTPDRPVRTLDCGCGNAFFTWEAARREGRCLGITIHDWERQNCEEMRDYLGMPGDRMQFRAATLEQLASDPLHSGQFDQVLLLDVIEHILDAPATLRQIRGLLDDDGFVYISTPDRDWQRHTAGAIRVSRHENGWHVRNGYTFEQLEALLENSGFEPIDRLRFGTLGSTVVTWIQHHLFGRHVETLTVLLFPVLKAVALALAPWRDTHTIFVLARKRRETANVT
jgi:2-polyprenyl-3-methyl-5-hydroxy-6-metoxy-1,4-benzoquinol methylase